jgi:hypothetical protein
MNDIDENGVDVVDRFRAYQVRFDQCSVAGEVYKDTLKYILHLRAERDALQKQVDELLDEKHAPKGAWGDFCNE